jgi:hypothetical protein
MFFELKMAPHGDNLVVVARVEVFQKRPLRLIRRFETD